jgi:hypothetical protein
MRRRKAITQPGNLNELGFEDLFEEVYSKIQHDWQKVPNHKSAHKWLPLCH